MEIGMRKTLVRPLGSPPKLRKGEGGEGGSFVRRVFGTARAEAEPLPAAVLLVIALLLSAALVGIVTVAVAKW
jgi:hypothetical protein